MRRYLLIFIALWLPLANAWALMMPCEHAGQHTAAKAPSQPQAPCHGSSKQQSSDAANHAGQCVHCAHCHLSSVPLISSFDNATTPRPSPVKYTNSLGEHISFIPRLPLPPPVA